MDEETAFREAMRRDPNDEHTRLVYADWLDEHGRPQPAARLRWWVGAMQHLRDQPVEHAHPHGANAMSQVQWAQHSMPEWVARLNQVYATRRMLQGTPAEHNDAVNQAFHDAELHALGLDSPEQFETARHNARMINAHAIYQDGLYVKRAANAVLRPSSHDPEASTAPLLAHVHRASVMSIPSSFSGPAMDQAVQDSHRLLGYTMNESPVKLARPLGWLKDRITRFLGRTDAERKPEDGIVYKHADQPTATYAERNAVAQALRLLGAPDHMARVPRYVAHVAQFVKEHPEHAIVQAYKDKAQTIGGTAGPELVEAVKPLVGAVNLLLSAHGLDQRFVRPESEAAPRPVAAHDTASPVAPPADSHSVFTLPDLDEPPTLTHQNVLAIIQQAGSLDAAKKHLKDTYGHSHQEAHEAVRNAILMHTGMKGYRAWQRARKKQPDAKLAAYKGGPIDPKHLAGESYRKGEHAAKIDRHIADTALAYHTRLIAQRHPELAPLAERALASTTLTLPKGHGTNKEGGHWGELGRRLKALNDPAAKFYDWANMEEHINQDKRLETVIKNAVEHTARRAYQNEDEKNLGFWDGVARRFTNHEPFLRLIGDRSGYSADQIRESIARIRNRALDKAYTRAAEEPAVWNQSLPEGEPAPSPKERRSDWRGTLGAAPRTKLARMDHAKQEWISKKVAKIMREGVRGKKVKQDQAVAIAYSMYREGKDND